ncbi:MAG: Serine/threonine-protein phosphatase 2A activator 1 [Alectoria sarmentosa]|nr:MAG: Serine/threonine-protein phosphatase 2A activator 1 [Alectoria sarmentosa]
MKMDQPAATSVHHSASTAPSLELLSRTQPHTFIKPLKKIDEGQDVSTFLISKAYGDIMTFLLQLNQAMFPLYNRDVSTSGKNRVQTWDVDCQAIEYSETVRNLRRLLEELDQVIDEVPPDPGPRRFGNASFRKWYQTVEERTSDLLKSRLSKSTLQYPHDSDVTADSELSSYFLGSFGSSQRLDYGSGHELSFLAFLGCIWKLGGFTSSSEHPHPGNEERAIVLGLIVPYLTLIRRLILTYTLEPAGSHGVWGLDDHSFIPYIFGSAQYGPAISPSDQTPIEGSRLNAPDPADVAKISAVERQRHQNMYFGAIGFIHDVKKGPFWEHSPMLYDISGIRTGWGKINKGMIKMYNAEVLSKFPVVQHFPFGSLFSFDQDPNAKPPPTSIHAANQPVRDGFGSSTAEKIAAPRASPQSGTPAPWASPATSVPGVVEAGTAAPWASRGPSMPGPSVGTAAPWARGRTAMINPGDGAAALLARNGTPSSAAELGTAAPWASSQLAAASAGSSPTRFPPSGVRPPPPPAGRTRPPETAGNDAAAQSMPPPTRAPWAKPP